jgi:hypothetical protein
MRQEHGSSAPLSRKELLGGPRNWLLFIAMVGSMYLADRASHAFPTLDPNPTASFVVAGGFFLLSFAILAHVRPKLMPWGPHAPVIMWGTIAALAAYAGALAWSVIYIGNGALDRASPHEVRYTILTRYTYHDAYLLRVAPDSTSGEPGSRPFVLDVTEGDWDASTTGGALVLDQRPGFFRLRWIAGYRLCQGKEQSC